MKKEIIKFCSNCGARLDEDNLKCERVEVIQYRLTLIPSPELAWKQDYSIEYDETDRDCNEERYYCNNCGNTIENMFYDEALETLEANQNKDEQD